MSAQRPAEAVDVPDHCRGAGPDGPYGSLPIQTILILWISELLVSMGNSDLPPFPDAPCPEAPLLQED